MATSIPGVDLDQLTRWLDAEMGLETGRVAVDVISGGKSNLTYLVRDGSRSWVLRRGPLGHALPTAHDMSREWRVLDALAATAVPVPQVLARCTDAAVIGAPFYLMERVDGRVVRDADDAQRLSAAEAQRASVALPAMLARLHQLDWHDIGLGTLGRPGHFVARQLERWAAQWERCATRPLATASALHRRLAATMPRGHAPALLHGDLRLDNVIVDHADAGTIRAVVDWEMSTVGDPLADVGTLMMYWCPDDGGPVIDVHAVTAGPSFSSRGELAAAYTAAGGADLDGIDWYLGFAHYKLAVIVEGIHARHLAGETVGQGFATLGATVPVLIDAGMDYAAGRQSVLRS